VSGPGTLTLAGANVGIDTVSISGGTLELSTLGALAAGVTADFAGGATLLLDPGAAPAGAIAGFGAGDVLVLAGLPFVAGAGGHSAGGTLSVTSGGKTMTLTAPGLAAGTVFVATAAAGGGTAISVQTSFTVDTVAALAAAISAIDIGGTSAAANVAYSISLAAGTFALTAELPAIDLEAGSSLALAGGGATLDGGGAVRGLFVDAGAVDVNGLTIAHARATGGAGGSGQFSGGGGMGAGGGLFVAAGATVTLQGVSFVADSAHGGAGGILGTSVGGGGGMGGAGGAGALAAGLAVGGGGGLGLGASGGTAGGTGDPGILPGAGGGASTATTGGGGGLGASGIAGGFGGGGGGGYTAPGGAGGFGGGGGGYFGINPAVTGGAGGFGGGGGAAPGALSGGAGGFGGAAGSGNYGGAGLGAGGGVFVQQGGVLMLGAGRLSGGSVSAGGTGAGAFGAGIFAQGTNTLTLDPGAGLTLDIGDAIADEHGSVPSDLNAVGIAVASGLVRLDVADSYSGGSTIAGGATLDLLASGAAGGGAIGFAGVGGTLAVGASVHVANTIATLGYGDAFDVAGLAGGAAQFNSITKQLVVSNASLGLSLTLTLDAASYNPVAFTAVPDAAGTGLLVTYVACFAAGTRLLTAGGERAVETLRVGDVLPDLVARRLRRVVWIGHKTVFPAAHPRQADVLPVRVRRDAFGRGMPHRDLVVSPDHALHVRGRPVPARRLIDGKRVVREHAESVTYWHVELDAHGVLLAEGMPAESYLDTGGRAAFTAAAAPTPAWLAAVRREAHACATS
jgi:hypothetical protein